MPIDLATIAMLGALQALLLVPPLLAATRAYSGVARRSLHVWNAALVLQGLGWTLMAMHGRLAPWVTFTIASGSLLGSYAATTCALRMLLRQPRRRLLVGAVTIIGWLGIAWFGVVRPDYAMRRYASSLATSVYLMLLIAPLFGSLRRGGSRAQRAMLFVLLAGAVVWAYRLALLLTGVDTGNSLLTLSLGNVISLVYGATEPVLATIGFMLIYNEDAQAELRRQARTDPLTGVLNRLGLDEEAERLFRQARSEARPLAALMIDTDHFKQVNDHFGHADGDRVLARLAACLGGRLRHADRLGRIGGEEFLVLLPDTATAEAMALGEQLRSDVAALKLMTGSAGLTISIGVAVSSAADTDEHALIHRADRALYAAKHTGRNRVVTAAA
ncbi:GGDEF domain-containing protein [Dyella sp. A6]|uniref:GGDEF domain-containing protein n=1 Tax=Dyella aluminiiresistens TaxID=3069105 RepID=UPI002E777F96|nr:GGDEF domain-containing protein [Dyella sp. A6]